MGFDKNRGRKRDEIALNKNTKGKYHLRIKLKDVFGLVKNQEKFQYGLVSETMEF